MMLSFCPKIEYIAAVLSVADGNHNSAFGWEKGGRPIMRISKPMRLIVES